MLPVARYVYACLNRLALGVRDKREYECEYVEGGRFLGKVYCDRHLCPEGVFLFVAPHLLRVHRDTVMRAYVILAGRGPARVLLYPCFVRGAEHSQTSCQLPTAKCQVPIGWIAAGTTNTSVRSERTNAQSLTAL